MEVDLNNITDDYQLLEQAKKMIVDLLIHGIDCVKTESESIPLILVGGGSIIIPDDLNLTKYGISSIILPKNYHVTNAIGAAICKFSGEYEGIFTEEMEKESIISFSDLKKKCVQAAIDNAIKKGALKELIIVYNQDEQVIPYTKNKKFFAKAIGFVNLVQLINSENSKTNESNMASDSCFFDEDEDIKPNKDPVKPLNSNQEKKNTI